MDRRPRYTMDDKPEFEDGEIVEIDTHYFGIPEEESEYVECVVRGKHGVDQAFTLWVLDVGGELRQSTYPYSCIVIPHYAIIKKEDQYAY